MTHNLKTTLIAASTVMAFAATSALAQTYPSDFAGLDADQNGQVTFAEYSMVVKTSGLTTTAAAQQFTRISAGDAFITEEELNLALAFQDQPYALQNMNSGAAITYANTAPDFEPPVSEVQPAPIAESEPILIENAPAETVRETPMPEVEIIRDPVPEMADPITTSTQPEVIIQPDGSETKAPAPETSEIGMPGLEAAQAEETSDPQPEG